MPLSETRYGEILVLLAAAIGALLPVLVNPHATNLSPIWIVALSSGLAVIPLGLIMLRKRCWKDLKNRSGVKHSALAGLIVGVGYYGLVHWGSYNSNPQNVSILLCFEIFAAMLFLHNRNHERLSKKESLGAGLLFVSIVMIFIPDTGKPQLGDMAVLLASCLTPIGNVFMKLARRSMKSASILCVRNFVSAIVLIVFGMCFSDLPLHTDLNDSFWILIVNGMLVLGVSKIFWVEGIYRIPIAKAAALTTISPIVTFIGAWLFLDKAPNLIQTLSLPPTIIGMLLIMSRKQKAR